MEITRQQIFIRLVFGAVWGSLSLNSAANADTKLLPKSTSPFQGLQTVVVVSENLQPETLEAGISKAWLRQLLQEKLTRAGIRAITESDLKRIDGFTSSEFPSALGIYVDADRDPQTGLYSGFYRLALLDSASLVRNPQSRVSVTTWFKEGMIRSTTRRGFKRAVEAIAADSLNEFVQRYRSANGQTFAAH